MANVTTRTANWRLFGGGGLALGGLLWTLSWTLAMAKVPTVPSWLFVVGLIIVAVALVFVAFGETGSNGAVGKYTLGKLALVLYAAGWLLLGVSAAQYLGSVVAGIAGVLIIVGGFAAAYTVYQKHVAKGAARAILFAPAVLGTFYALGLWIPEIGGLVWLSLPIALAFLVTGVLYLFNDRRIG